MYNENGRLIESGDWSNRIHNGEWKYYHNNGAIYRIITWDQGRVIDVLFCKDGAGNDLDIGTIKRGNGTMRNYDIDGKFLFKDQFIEGVMSNNEANGK